MAIFLILLILFSIPVSFQHDQFTFNGFCGMDTSISLSGAAQFNWNGSIQLTDSNINPIGHGFYSFPLRFKNATTGLAFSFSTCFAFSIHPSSPTQGSGDGLAFFFAQSNNFSYLNQASSQLGLFNASGQVNDISGNYSNRFFAVEFDTYQNYVLGDINDNHVGIDMNNVFSISSAAAAYFGDDLQNHTINLKGGQPTMAWIEYDSITNFLNVTLSISSTKPKRPLLSLQHDLSSVLDECMYVGFSASSGEGPNYAQKIYGWSFNMNEEVEPLNLSYFPSNLPPIKRRNHTALVIRISMSTFLFILGLSVIVVFLIRKVKNIEMIEPWELERGPHRFKYLELKKATRGFKDTELLGVGGFGRVYKGILPKSRMEVAVKRISHESRQGVREFASEISSIGRLRHRNLVLLLGWCRRENDLLLVYEFMFNGSLDKFLFKELKCVLSWDQRLKIIKGVASGLFYLHEGYEQVVIHRDVKASNVLLDGDMNAKLGDFGLSKVHDRGSDPSTSRVVGTLGYISPEFARTGRATTSSDVFAFGNLLLEVTCGRRVIQSEAASEELLLPEYAWSKFLEGKLLDVVDPKMKGEFDENEVLLVLKLGLMCSSNEQFSRPTMKHVMSYLDGELGLPEFFKPPVLAFCNEVRYEDYLNSYALRLVNENGNSCASDSTWSWEIPR